MVRVSTAAAGSKLIEYGDIGCSKECLNGGGGQSNEEKK